MFASSHQVQVRLNDWADFTTDHSLNTAFSLIRPAEPQSIVTGLISFMNPVSGVDSDQEAVPKPYHTTCHVDGINQLAIAYQ